MAKRRSSFGQLTHRDLKAFDQRAARLVLEAIDAGCTGRVSSKGHAILRNSGGQTACVPPNSIALNRSSQNTAADIKRLLEGHTTRSKASPLPTPYDSPITVAEALTAHGMAFSTWMDAQDGLCPDDEIEVAAGPDGSPCFARLPASGSTPVEAPPADPDELEKAGMLEAPIEVDVPALGTTSETEETVYSVAEVAEANALTGRTVRNRLRVVGGREEDGRYRATPSRLRRAGLRVPSHQLARAADAVEILGQIRSLLGEDPRVQVHEAEKKALSDLVAEQKNRAVAAEERCAELEKELHDTKARLALVKEAFEA